MDILNWFHTLNTWYKILIISEIVCEKSIAQNMQKKEKVIFPQITFFLLTWLHNIYRLFLKMLSASPLYLCGLIETYFYFYLTSKDKRPNVL